MRSPTDWFVVHSGQEYGPYTPAQLREFVGSGQLRRKHVLRPESDDRLIAAGSTTLFTEAPPLDENGMVPVGTECPVEIDTGYQPAAYGSIRPTDGYFAGVRRVLTWVMFGKEAVFDPSEGDGKGKTGSPR